jgi:hypothetical protein
MPQYCTCGAELVPDALFCHKCGRPLRDFTPPAEASPETEPVAPGGPVIPSDFERFRRADAPADNVPSFRNAAAVRVGLSMASFAALLSAIPVVGALSFVWFFFAGFFAPFVYRKRTGHTVTTRNGARMGWITGVFAFLIITILATITELFAQTGGISAAFREQIEKMPAGDPNMARALEYLQTPAGIAFLLVFAFFFMFLFTMLLCTAGGALGAKVAQKD